jgi:hypothetical protein
MNTTSPLRAAVSGQPYLLLFATISGAHLYGFPAPDSDFDLRGGHVLPLEKVVGLDVRDETVQDSRVIEGLDMNSRPMLLHAVARQTTHAGQTVVRVTPLHAEEPKIRKLLTELSQFLTTLQATAEQLTCGQRWCRILSRIFRPLLPKVAPPPTSASVATAFTRASTPACTGSPPKGIGDDRTGIAAITLVYPGANSPTRRKALPT